MPARRLAGRWVADAVLDEVRATVAGRGVGVRPPGLAAVLVGDDPASQVYVRNKIEACARCGIVSRLETRPADVSSSSLAALVEALNSAPDVDGILLQLPLPARLDPRPLLLGLDPGKDVDGLHPVNLGKLVADDDSGFVPCTPAGVVELLRRHDVELEGRHVVVLGRSHLVGKPLALLLLRRGAGGNATVTVLHTRSRDLSEIVRRADLVVAAAGSPGLVRGHWLKPGAVVVDVGIHRVPDPTAKHGTRLVGDVDFEAASAVASAITPVPGGVGPMTVAMLMRNTALAWRRHLEAGRGI
jgi:methylenetetrahydrofolate dehydrogenase (NADP+)/methenyltetrahydrofolate cyclohydrolase